MFDDYKGDITQRRLQRTLQKYFLLKTTLDLCKTSNNKKCNYNNSNIVTFEFEVYLVTFEFEVYVQVSKRRRHHVFYLLYGSHYLVV